MKPSFDTINRTQVKATRPVTPVETKEVLTMSSYTTQSKNVWAQFVMSRMFLASLSAAVICASCLMFVFNLVPNVTNGEGFAKIRENYSAKNSSDAVSREEPISITPELVQPMAREKAAETRAATEKANIAAQIVVVATKSGSFDTVYAEAEKKYGVSRFILAAVHYVETRQSGDTVRSSSAGAIGPMQFMPGTFAAYAEDGDGDGLKQISDVHDAIYSAAKNLAANGAKSNKVKEALFNYNHSDEYVQEVLKIARGFGYREE